MVSIRGTKAYLMVMNDANDSFKQDDPAFLEMV
jgi:hypothetical protein